MNFIVFLEKSCLREMDSISHRVLHGQRSGVMELVRRAKCVFFFFSLFLFLFCFVFLLLFGFSEAISC